MKRTISIALLIICLFSFAACKDSANTTDLWENATYTEITELGEGANTVKVEVKVEEHIITFTINTDKDKVGEALLEHNLIEGDEGAYGLYVKKVNGITADYDIDQSYWSFYINGEIAMAGVDTTDIDENATYRIEYTK